MCGRFVLITDLSVIGRDFIVPNVSVHFEPSRDVRPGDQITAVVRRGGHNELVLYQWGLIPAWCKDPSIGAKLINARAETIIEKPSFRKAFLSRRCLIPADAFYEWKKEGGRRIPYLFSLASGQTMGFAGLHEAWMSPDRKLIQTCTIITTRANALVEPIHDRMPVIVPTVRQDLWLNPAVKDPQALLDCLKPYPACAMICTESDLSGPAVFNKSSEELLS